MDRQLLRMSSNVKQSAIVARARLWLVACVTVCSYDAIGQMAKVLCAYQGVPAPQNGCPALLLKVDDVVDILSSEDEFWLEVSLLHTAVIFINDTFLSKQQKS